MGKHGDVLDDLVLVGRLQPLQEGMDREGNVIDGETAYFSDIGQIWILRLFFCLG